MPIPNISQGLNAINKPFNLSSMLSFGQGNTNSPVNTPAPVGQTDPSKVASSTAVQHPANTSAQSNVISQGAKSNDLVSQLYNQVSPADANKNIATNGLYAPKVANSPQPTGSGTPANTGNNSLGYGIGTTTPTTPTTPVAKNPATTTTNPSTTDNAMLNDPLLSAINANIENVAGQEANIQGNQNKFVTDQYGNALSSPTTADFFNNQTGAGSFNAMKTAQEEGNLGLEMSALQSGFNNRESQLEKGYTPVAVAPGTTEVNPYNAQPIAGGLGGYEGYQNAQQVNNLIGSYPDAKDANGQSFKYDQSQTPAENLQNFQNNYLKNSPTYQQSTYGKAGANSVYEAGQIAGNAGAIASNTQTAGELSGIRDSVSNMSNALIGQLATSKNFNPSNITAANSAVQAIASNTSDPQYQTLLNQMTDIAATYAQILNPGASTDSSRATAQGLINTLAKGSTIQQVIQGLDAQAQKKISGYQTAAGDISGGRNPNPSAGQVGPTVTAPDGTQIIITD